MNIQVFNNKEQLGEQAASRAAGRIQAAIAERGEAAIILATGKSQFSTLKSLVEQPIAWEKVTMFHLDEYVGISVDHNASFRKYLKERFLARIPSLKGTHMIKGDADDPQTECQRLGEIISNYQIDVALVGIGENGHLAFNDPPADFETEDPYIVVKLDRACRKQQVGEGWFKTIEDVPDKAITMSINQIMKVKTVICSVPGQRKAEATHRCVEGPVTNEHPASILQQLNDCTLYLDNHSASLLNN